MEDTWMTEKKEKHSPPGEDGSPNAADRSSRASGLRPGARILTFLICFVTWIVLSGRFDMFHLALGLIASGIVALISTDTLFPTLEIRHLPGMWAGFIRYLPWLLGQVFLANLRILYLTFHPRMKELIQPRLITFHSRLKDDMAILIFANSITLTPGTVTVHVSLLGKYTVHAIDNRSAGELPGLMEKKVENIFNTEKNDPELT